MRLSWEPCSSLLLAAGATFEERPLTPGEQARAAHLYTVFVAPCCWRQSVAFHQSPEAKRVRRQIDQAVIAGASDFDIKKALIREYGHGILMEPEGIRRVAVYLGPILAFAIGLVAALRWIRDGAENVRNSEAGPGPTAGELPDLEFDA